MNSITETRTREILSNLKNKKIAVIGDVMLDRYFWGSVSRISPEAPVPVIDIESETNHLGGAANVAANLNSLGVKPFLCGIIGDDTNGQRFNSIASYANINTSALYVDKSRPTTVKTRIIGNNQQIARLDKEVREELSIDGKNFIINQIKAIDDLSGIIFEDYNKGAVSEDLINEIISYTFSKNIPVYVDPKFDNFFVYQGVTVFKPNRKEASKAIGKELKTIEDVNYYGKILLEKLNAENLLLTLGADGMMLFEKNGNISQVPTRARHVADVSGAGDTAIATLSAAISGGADIREAAALANFASGVVCEVPGIVSILPDQLLETVKRNGVDKY